MNNNDERDYEEEADNARIVGIVRQNQLFVGESLTGWTVWHIIDMPDKEINSFNEDVCIPTLNGSHIWPQAMHFWTKDAMQDFVDGVVSSWGQTGEFTEVIFI